MLPQPEKGIDASMRSFLQLLFLTYGATPVVARRIAVPSRNELGNRRSMAGPSPERAPSASEQLEALLGEPWPFPGRPPKYDLSTWRAVDDWPDPVPVTMAEVEVFERWFSDLFDELFFSPF